MTIPAPSPEAAFERYRRAGDAAALAAVFETTAPGLLRVAMQLSDDPAQAEDALQSTFVTAMEKASSWDGARPLVPWLAGILQLHCKVLRARARKSPEPGRMTTRVAVDPLDAAAANELDRGLRDAIDALPAAYRTVVVLRLRQGMAPAAIAHALGESPGAIRVRLHRGLVMLRQRLPRGIAAPALASSALRIAPERGLDAVARVVAKHASHLAPSAATAALATVLTMKKLVIGSVAALALCVAVAASLVGGEDSPPGDPDSQRTTSSSRSAGPTSPRTSDGPAAQFAANATDHRSTVDSTPAPLGRGIRVVAKRTDGAPAPRIGITVLPHDGRHPDLHTLRRFTDRDGVALFCDLAPGRYGVWVDRAARPWSEKADEPPPPVTGDDRGAVTVLEGPMHELLIQNVHARLSSEIRILTDLATVIEPAGVQIAEVTPLGEPPPPSEPDCKLSAELPDRGALATVDVTDGFVLVLVEVEGGTRVQGTVRDANGELVAGAEVWVVRDRGRTAFGVATTARDGTFAADDLDAGTALFARALSHASSRSVEITGDNSQAIALVLGARAAEVAGIITDAAGRPIAGARVRIGDPDEDDARRVQVPSDDHGAFHVPAPALGRVELLVLAPGFQPWLGDVEVTEAPRDPLRITLIAGAVIAGVVRGPDGEPREGLRVRANAEGQPVTDVLSGSGGAYRLECLAPGPLWLVVDEADDHRGACTSAVGVVGVEQHVDLTLGRWGKLSGVVLDAAGQPIARARVLAVPVSGDALRTVDDRTDDAGAFELRTHPERRYRLEVAPERADQPGFTLRQARGSATLAFLLFEAGGEPSVAGHRRIRCDWLGDLDADRSDVEVRLPVNCVPSARLAMRLLDPDARPLAAALVVHVDGGSRSVRPSEDGRIDLGPLVPGEYRFEVRPDDDALEPFDLTLRALGVNERIDLGDVFARRRG